MWCSARADVLPCYLLDNPFNLAPPFLVTLGISYRSILHTLVISVLKYLLKILGNNETLAEI